MHMHICPSCIAAGVEAARQGLPYLKASWHYYIQTIKDKIHERKDCSHVEKDECQRQEL